MPRRRDRLLRVAAALLLSCGPGCSSVKTQTAVVGHHRVRFVLPQGWEHLDHGRQQLFRLGEAQVSLVDLGPATRDAMVRELEAADSLWRSGRRRDAFQRVRELRSPALRFAPSLQRADFWKPWTDVTYIPEAADSFAIGTAFEALIAGTAVFAPVTTDRVLEYVLVLTTETQRREIGHRDRRKIHGSEWIDVETWNRVSHLDRSRVAFAVDDGYLLVLAIDHGRSEQAAPGFEALLTSLELGAGAPPTR